MTANILSAILVLITGYYAWVTHRILQANRKTVEASEEQLEALRRPYVNVVLILVPQTPIFALVIRNDGKTAASELQLSIDRPVSLPGDAGEKSDLRDLNAFKEPIQSFGPSSELNFWLGSAVQIFGRKSEDLPKRFTVEASYSYGDKKVTEQTTIDFNPFLYSDLPRNEIGQGFKEVTQEIKKLRNSIEKFNKS